MSGLKQELGLAQGIGLLSTSLLGTGVFAVPALAALVAGNNSLWAWPVLIILVFPIAIVFAILGRHYPSAGGVAHFVGMAFRSEEHTSELHSRFDLVCRLLLGQRND